MCQFWDIASQEPLPPSHYGWMVSGTRKKVRSGVVVDLSKAGSTPACSATLDAIGRRTKGLRSGQLSLGLRMARLFVD